MKTKRGLQAWITGLKIYFWPPFLGVSKYWKVLVATAAINPAKLGAEPSISPLQT